MNITDTCQFWDIPNLQKKYFSLRYWQVSHKMLHGLAYFSPRPSWPCYSESGNNTIITLKMLQLSTFHLATSVSTSKGFQCKFWVGNGLVEFKILRWKWLGRISLFQRLFPAEKGGNWDHCDVTVTLHCASQVDTNQFHITHLISTRNFVPQKPCSLAINPFIFDKLYL